MSEDLWADQAVAETLGALGLTSGADTDLPDEVRFVRGVMDALEASIARRGPLASPAVFVFAPSRRRLASLNIPSSFHRRIHTGETDPAGRIWLVGAAVKSADAIEISGETSDEIIGYCEQLGFESMPAVYCDTTGAPGRFAWYPRGFGDPDEVIEGPIGRSVAPTLDELLDVVDRVHWTRLVTSFNQGMDTALWQDANRHWVHKRAEKRVQDALMAGLGGAFGRPYFVQQEIQGHSGRFDIGFREAQDGTSTLHAILELKVARSYGSTGAPVASTANDAHLVEGVEQAWAYSDEHGARDAACLVFDLRLLEQQQPPGPAATRAAVLDVVLRVWRCFPTAEHYRTFKMPEVPAV